MQGQLEAKLEADSAIWPRIRYLHKENRYRRDLNPLQQRSQRKPRGVEVGEVVGLVAVCVAVSVETWAGELWRGCPLVP